MKKLLQFITLLALTLTVSMSKAQLITGSIAADFTFTDIDGNTQHLYDILDSGKTVFIDVSAAWCDPCWDFHNSHAFDSLHNDYGPTGTNELRVLFIEGEFTNSMAQLSGTSTGSTYATYTKGDWITGTPYPIIDLSTSTPGASTFMTDYNIGAFPTIYMICPDRSVTEMGMATAASMYAAKSVCAAANYAADGKMITALEFNIGLASCDSVMPTFRFVNIGTDTLESATITLAVDGTPQKTINWTGSLDTYESTTLTGHNVGSSVAGAHTITATISNPNGATDSTASNNTTSTSFVYYPATGGSLISENFETSGVPNDWTIIPGGTYSWTEDPSVGLNSTASVVVPFFVIPTGQVDYLRLPPMSFTGTTTASMSFDVACAQYSSSDNDRLQVEVSTDCGTTWSTKYDRAGATLKTVPPVNNAFFVPTNSQWRHEQVVLNSIAGQQLVLVRFKTTSGYGNALYVDNINFSTVDVTSIEENMAMSSVSIYPNPAAYNTTIEFNLSETKPVSIVMINALGQEVMKETLGKISAGFQKHIISTEGLENGLYIMQIKAGNETITQKITVSK